MNSSINMYPFFHRSPRQTFYWNHVKIYSLVILVKKTQKNPLNYTLCYVQIIKNYSGKLCFNWIKVQLIIIIKLWKVQLFLWFTIPICKSIIVTVLSKQNIKQHRIFLFFKRVGCIHFFIYVEYRILTFKSVNPIASL